MMRETIRPVRLILMSVIVAVAAMAPASAYAQWRGDGDRYHEHDLSRGGRHRPSRDVVIGGAFLGVGPGPLFVEPAYRRPPVTYVVPSYQEYGYGNYGYGGYGYVPPAYYPQPPVTYYTPGYGYRYLR